MLARNRRLRDRLSCKCSASETSTQLRRWGSTQLDGILLVLLLVVWPTDSAPALLDLVFAWTWPFSYTTVQLPECVHSLTATAFWFCFTVNLLLF